MKGLVHNIKTSLAKASAQVTGSGTGVVFDTQGFHSVTIALLIAAISAADADNTLTFSVEEGDSALAYDFVEVPAARVLSAAVINATSQAQSVKKYGVVVGTKRYMRIKYTEAGTFDAVFGAIAILGHAEDMPVA